MQKLFSAKQIRKADQFTIKNEPISSIQLMERAANKAYKWILKYAKEQEVTQFAIFCGTGNNGGDGLVISRLLQQEGYLVNIYVLELGEYSSDFRENLSYLKSSPISLTKEDHSFQMDNNCLIIDAIFGTGISRPIQGFTANVIAQLNDSENDIISIDLPSGLTVEENINIQNNAIVKANHTLSFQFPKLSFLFPESENYVGHWHVLDIGLSKTFSEEEETSYYYTRKQDVKEIVRPRSSFSHKGTYGHACIVAGSEGKIGAAILASKACLRSGVGLLTARIPAIGQAILQSTVPESMVIKDENEAELVNIFDMGKYTAIGVGPGIGTSSQTQNFIKNFLKEVKTPLVVDADALNILSLNNALLNKLPQGSILTPHPGEFKRLVGQWENDYHRLQLQRELSQKYGTTIVLKGKNTSITTKEGNVYFNSTGNSGMATGGSGDVLTGILTALLAQGYSSKDASILGVYLHGLAGDLACKKYGREAMIASDIIEYLGEAFHAIHAI